MVDEPENDIADEGIPSVADRSSIEVLPDDSVTGIPVVIGDLGRLDRAVYGVIGASIGDVTLALLRFGRRRHNERA